ncbi:MAG TPA: hypothetical protein PLX15_02300 [Candidatus Woesearchaeota archaeon]|nr:hypothetical protein [Candidatus Woesearchaeota archaeon]
MPKQLRDYPIYIAPQIRGYKDRTGQPIVFDERTNRNLNPNDIDDKILIYERQVKDWFLNRASRLVNGNKNGFIVLMISISYIEGVQQYIKGQTSHNNSGRFFREGMRRIFQLSDSDNVLNDFYAQVRCGLFHSGMTQNKVVISRDYEQVIDFSEHNTIKINPKLFLRAIRLDFNRYINLLKNPENNNERNNFNRMFSNI